LTPDEIDRFGKAHLKLNQLWARIEALEKKREQIEKEIDETSRPIFELCDKAQILRDEE